MTDQDIERLIAGRAHMESQPAEENGSEHEHGPKLNWRLHLTISVESIASGLVREQHYRTKLTFASREDCDLWHRDYFSCMMRLIYDETLSRQFRAAVVTQLIDLFEPVGKR